jgi:hypothetical protein
VTLSYTGGYAAIPPDIAQATIELAAFRYKARDRIGVKSHSQDRLVVDSFEVTAIPSYVCTVLNRYRRVSL